MTTSDLDLFEHRDHKLEQGEQLAGIFVRAPSAPDADETQGGPVYVSVGQHLDIQVTDLYTGEVLDDGEQVSVVINGTSTKTSTNETESKRNLASTPKKTGNKAEHYIYSNSLVEYYYYINPVVKKVEPNSGLTSGGTKLEISGAWFDLKPEYGVIPQCKIGEKVTRAIFSSTVRIVCFTPPSENTITPVPIKVSLNGVDWVDTGAFFSYYRQPEIMDMNPRSGPITGGTEIVLSGDHFSNITDPNLFKCRFDLVKNPKNIPPKTMPAHFQDQNNVLCVSPSGYLGGDQVYVELAYNGIDFTPRSDNLIFSYFNIANSFPKSGPADAFDEVILVKGQGFKQGMKVVCNLNRTEIDAISVTENLIKCPMALPSKDPKVTGNVKFGVSVDGAWTDLGGFYYYKQIVLNDMNPKIGPAEGEGYIYFYGTNFRDDFPNHALGCKIGDNVGQAVMTEPGTMRCVVESMDLVNEGEALPASLSLNSYSWVGGSQGQLGFVPYGVDGVFPNSGPFDGFTDILITGKGFSEEIAPRARCRFGVEADYAIVDAEVVDYNKLVCRSPQDFKIPANSAETISVPIGIAFNDEEFKPWTQDLHRFRFYTQPTIVEAIPDEVEVGKMVEIYVFAGEDSKFFERK